MDDTKEYVVVGVVIVVILTFLYAVVLRGVLLEWLTFLLLLGFLYLAVRFVRAVERIADAFEE